MKRLSLIPLLVLAGGTLSGCRTDATWAPDGKSLALDTRGHLMTFDPGAKTFRKFPDAAPNASTYAVNPAWTPDGKKLLYYRAGLNKQEEVSSLQLTVLDVAAGRSTPLIATLPTPKIDQNPEGLNLNVSSRMDLVQETVSAAVSPDGKWIAYVAFEGQDPALFIAAADGTGSRPLVKPVRPAMHPVWSPDGAWIAFHGVPPSSTGAPGEPPMGPDKQAGSTLEVIAPDGSGNRVLWKADATDKIGPMGPDPVWAVDGKSLYVFTDIKPATNQDVPYSELWSVSADGGDPKKLTNGNPLQGPSMFATMVPGGLALFVDPAKKETKVPRLGLLSAPFTDMVNAITLPAKFLGEDQPSMEVDGMPVPSISPDGKTVAIPFVPKGGVPHLIIQATAGGAAQRFPIPAPSRKPATPVKKPAAPVKKPGKATKPTVKPKR